MIKTIVVAILIMIGLLDKEEDDAEELEEVDVASREVYKEGSHEGS